LHDVNAKGCQAVPLLFVRMNGNDPLTKKNEYDAHRPFQRYFRFRMMNLIDAGPDDSAFLYELFSSSKLEEIAGWNWPAAEQQEFVRMQHNAQQHSYSLQYPHASNKIILCDGHSAGRLLTARTDIDIAVIDIVLLPAFRSRGIGTAVLLELQQAARAEGRGLGLHVMFNSPARRLYARLGFSDVSAAIPHIRMRWQP
jgi:GNAT superfamily N-acetyltransferase